MIQTNSCKSYVGWLLRMSATQQCGAVCSLQSSCEADSVFVQCECTVDGYFSLVLVIVYVLKTKFVIVKTIVVILCVCVKIVFYLCFTNGIDTGTACV